MDVSKFNSMLTPEKLEKHAYHNIAILQYGEENVSLECNDCSEVLADANVSLATRVRVNQ